MAPPCKFGVRCYRRKNKKHMEDFSHEGVGDVRENGSTSGESPTKVKRSRSASGACAEQSVKHTKVDVADDELSKDVKSKFLVSFPSELFRFWKDINSLLKDECGSDPCNVLNVLKNLRLVGVFGYLAGHFDRLLTEDEALLLTKDRFSSDLPEMRTIAVYDEGRFAYWSDAPDEDKPLLIHVDSKMEHFAKLDIAGISDPVYMIAWLRNRAGDKLANADAFLTKLVHPDCALCNDKGKYDAKEFRQKYDAALKELRAKRRKQSLGEPFHGLGIVVKVENDIGYRPLSETPARLKRLLEEIGTADNADIKHKLMEKIMEMVSYVQFANDEMDFGMGLELGHNLFMSNYADFDKLAASLLSSAYALLGRNEFSCILKAHTGVRRLSEPEKKSLNEF